MQGLEGLFVRVRSSPSIMPHKKAVLQASQYYPGYQ